MGRDNQAGRSFLGRLLHDVTANTLAIAAASLMPLLAMVGGGIDASRYYMAAARLQAACDAGALAGRQAMGSGNTFTTANQQVALNFFDQNFNDGIFGTTGRTRSFTMDTSRRVNGTASATLPTTVMGAFGYTQFSLQATCSAEVNISNSDIMFVLDVTGSMADCPDGSNCNSGSGSKIVALRSAVMSFYDTVQASTSPAAQVRYGVVPYSQQVNVGFSIPRAHLANTHSYQSRVARYNPAALPGGNIGDPYTYSDATEWLPRNTANFNTGGTNNYRFRTDGSAGTTAQSVCTNYPGTYTVSVNGQNETWEVFATTQWVLDQWSGGSSDNRAGCRARVRKTRPATQTDITPQFRDWMYCQVTTGATNPCNVNNPSGSPSGWEAVDLTTVFASPYTVNMPIGTNGAMTAVSWAGCIEEPDTVLTDTYNPQPANAFDIDINLVPTTDAQRWHPALQNAVWERRDGSNDRTTAAVTDADRTAGGQSTTQSRPGWACPPAALKLREIATGKPFTRTDLQSYVDALVPGGNTYHDIGMVWGARFLSPRGIFASENATAPNGDPIARHIVFMTDGVQVNNVENYSTHGVEWWDRRITGNGDGTREFNRRAARLQAICRAAQAENITVWVVAFGTSLTSNLTSCASPGRAFQANDSATLQARFQEIAQKIAQLRLTQ
ncbi:pilus assembly protein TadG-related protein [Erythrobacter sp. NE805]|uniref:pilus assembly protein TadG-related protein n=1 Tax=Erythrobacter sp. NE805 TaxID=3389875 RepID=UPI00396B4619